VYTPAFAWGRLWLTVAYVDGSGRQSHKDNLEKEPSKLRSITVMATVKRYLIHCPKCNHDFPVFASLFHSIDVNVWMKDKSDNHDCKAYADQLAKERAPRALNPIKASKKGK
jgi:hypothetical protein